MPKWLILSIGGHKHDTRTQTAPIIPKKLIFGDDDLQKTRERDLFEVI